MINLLPPDIRDSYRYARKNTILRSWALVTLVSLLGLGAIGTYGLLALHQQTGIYAGKTVAAKKQLENQQLSQTEAKVKDISSSLQLAVKVLGQEVLFSKLIKQIGAAMPPGTVLTGLTINQTTGGLDLTAGATNYTTATQVQVNLSDPRNQIFSKVDINNINCSQQIVTDKAHPCTVSLRALFDSNNQFLFVNQGKKK